MSIFDKIHLIYYTRLYRCRPDEDIEDEHPRPERSGLMVRTADSHSVNRGPIPRRVTLRGTTTKIHRWVWVISSLS